MPRANPGEVWIVDLGLAAKVRPCLVLGDYPEDDELALIIIVPHTTAVRDNRWEVSVPKPFLKPGVFHLQQLQSVPVVRLQRKIGELNDEEFRLIRSKLSELLHLALRRREAPIRNRVIRRAGVSHGSAGNGRTSGRTSRRARLDRAVAALHAGRA